MPAVWQPLPCDVRFSHNRLASRNRAGHRRIRGALSVFLPRFSVLLLAEEGYVSLSPTTCIVKQGIGNEDWQHGRSTTAVFIHPEWCVMHFI